MLMQAYLTFSLRCILVSWPLAAVATETGTSISNDTSTSFASVQASPTAAPDGFEIDIIYPWSNETYNITESLPIVFAFQNISAAQSFYESGAGYLEFYWGIMPYGNVGEEQEPGGVLEAAWSWEINSMAPLPDPYILINTTNVTMWPNGPFFPYGSVYQLQFGINWYPNGTEGSDVQIMGWPVQGIFFNINLGDPEPNLLDVPECPQFGGRVDLSTNSSGSYSVPTSILDPQAGAPCAVKVDQAMASSISSVAQYSATATTSTSSAPTPSSTQNKASIPKASAESVLVIMVIFASLELVTL